MSDYCEIPSWYSEKWPAARKEHVCVECGDRIRIGELHGSFSGKGGGEVSTYRQHLECEEACRHIRDFFQDGECIGFGELFEYADDYASNKRNPERSHFRKVMARVKWRNEKRRGLPTWLGPLPVFNKALERDRNWKPAKQSGGV